MTDDRDKKPVRPGPEPERTKAEGDWKNAVRKALKKKKPPEGWPQGDDDGGEGDAMGDGT